jgi:hypothetical protein
VLPAPQVSDNDLEDLVKLSKTGADAIADSNAAAPSSALLQDYSETPRTQAARTPRAPAAKDSLLTEAQNIIALNQGGSVLEVSAATGVSRSQSPGPLLRLTTLCCWLPGWGKHAFASWGRFLCRRDACPR